VNSWFAWSYVLSPLTASLHLLNYQLKAMEEYLENPELHVRAAHDPALAGGPYLDIPAARAGEVKALLESTKLNQRHNLALAEATAEFYNRLVDEASGQSLDSFYKELPGPLRGYVELVYDYYNRPVARFIEGLLYASQYYDQSLQSLRFYPLKRDDIRRFFMSTPRLQEPEQIDWKVPFADERVDRFFALEVEPQPLSVIRDLLGLDPSADEKLSNVLSPAPPVTPDRWTGADIRVRYFGHACVLLEWEGTSVLTDPFIGVRPLEGGLERLSYSDLPRNIDYVLVTHNHSDHFLIESLLRLRHRIKCLVVPKSYGLLHGDISLKLLAQKLGFKQVLDLDALDSITIPGGEIVSIPFFGEHGDLAHGKTAYVVRAGEHRMMFGADSNCLDRKLYENVRRSVGRVETVFLGTECVGAPLSWNYGPLFPRPPQRIHDQTRRQRGCDSDAAIEIMEAIGARRFYSYGMGQEPWLEHILALGLSDQSPQLREVEALLMKARRRNFAAAERLFGKSEFFLESISETAEAEHCVPASLNTDAEDEFVW
jgi:L-ascorbate metabolism protein UlaG (beta-lactamase superfamily)